MANNSIPMEQEPHGSGSNFPDVSNDPGDISVLYTNIRNLKSNMDKLIYEVSISEPDIIILTETHLLEDRDSDKVYIIPGYNNLERADRDPSIASKCGGVAIYVAEVINNQAMSELTIRRTLGPCVKAEALWLDFKVGTALFSVAGIYRPPAISMPDDMILREFIGERLYNINQSRFDMKAKLIIAGDFNLSIDWDSELKEGTISKNSNPTRWRRFFEDANLIQCMPERSRTNFTSPPKWLDLIFYKNFQSQPKVMTRAPLGNSDHMIVYVEFGNRKGKGIWSRTRRSRSYWYPKIENNQTRVPRWKLEDIIMASASADEASNGWSIWMNTSEVKAMRTAKEEEWNNYKRAAEKYEKACENLNKAHENAMNLLQQKTCLLKLLDYIEDKLISDRMARDISESVSDAFIQKCLDDIDVDNAIETIGIPGYVLQENKDLIVPLILQIIESSYNSS